MHVAYTCMSDDVECVCMCVHISACMQMVNIHVSKCALIRMYVNGGGHMHMYVCIYMYRQMSHPPVILYIHNIHMVYITCMGLRAEQT